MIVVVVELVNLALAMREKKCTQPPIQKRMLFQKDGLWGRVFKDFSTFLQAEAHLSTPLSMARAFLAAWLFCYGLKDQRSTLLPVEDLTACEGA